MKTSILTFAVEPETEKWIKDAAWRQRKNVSAFIRDAVEAYFEKLADEAVEECVSVARQFSDVTEDRS